MSPANRTSFMDDPLPQENTNGLLAESSMDKQQAHFPDEKLHYKFAIFHGKSDPLGTVTRDSLATICKAFGNMYGTFRTIFHQVRLRFGYGVRIDFGSQHTPMVENYQYQVFKVNFVLQKLANLTITPFFQF